MAGYRGKRYRDDKSLPREALEFCVPYNDLIVLHPLGILVLVLVFSFLKRKIPFAGIELMSQRVRRLYGYFIPLSYRGDRLHKAWYYRNGKTVLIFFKNTILLFLTFSIIGQMVSNSEITLRGRQSCLWSR